MKNIVIYGGAFNPPTIAHVAITQAAANFAETINAEIWIMPSGDRIDKTISVNKDKRIAFIEALIGNIKTSTKLSICRYELFQSQTQTRDTVEYLHRKYPQYSFTWLFGSDSVITMPKWADGDKLIDSLNMLVVQRKGSEIELTSKMKLLEVEVPVVSSTEVRNRLIRSEPVDDIVPKNIVALL